MDKTIRLWDTATGKSTRIIEGHIRYVQYVATTSVEQLIASKGFDKTIRLWRSDTWSQVAVIPELSSNK